MPLATYTDLVATIADTLNRQDLAGAIPNFIVLAEAHFNRTLRTNDMEARVLTSLQFQFTQLPDDYSGMRLAPKILAYSTWNLEPVSADELEEFRARNCNATGCPKRYAIVGDSIEVEPTPDTAYIMRLAYYRQIPALATATGGTNWLFAKHPDLYLYTALLQSAPYLKDDERIPVWDGARQRIIDEITVADQRSTYGGTPRIKGRGIG